MLYAKIDFFVVIISIIVLTMMLIDVALCLKRTFIVNVLESTPA